MLGHAEQWDLIGIDGEVGRKNCSVGYQRDGGTLALSTIFRDL